MRKLATIQRIRRIQVIPNADAIEKATVLGWEVVIKKGEFKEGDLCVYCEIDSLLPERPEFNFLKDKGMRIKTIRCRGQISQGICFSLSILPIAISFSEGDDVTDILGIKKYEPEIPLNLAGDVLGIFPSFIPKTDEPRIQNLVEELKKYQKRRCYISEKLDGTSVTYYLNNGHFGVCSRNLELKHSITNIHWKVAIENNIRNKLQKYSRNIALQGEIVGSGINKNKYNLRGYWVYFFSAYDIDSQEYLDFDIFQQTIMCLDLPVVPIINSNHKLIDDIPSLVKQASGCSVLNPAIAKEGIVVRSLIQEKSGRISFKVINPDFLLKYE